jgi:hypothetical protein
MYGGAVSWASKKQSTTAASTMEAKYQACGAVAREVLSLIKALKELGPLSVDFPLPGPVVITCDSKATLSLCYDPKEGQRSKHVYIVHHFAREWGACVRTLHLYAATYSHYSLSLATTQSSIAELLLLFNHNILGCLTTT